LLTPNCAGPIDKDEVIEGAIVVTEIGASVMTTVIFNTFEKPRNCILETSPGLSVTFHPKETKYGNDLFLQKLESIPHVAVDFCVQPFDNERTSR
jgi:hypothetical protein